MPLRVRLSDRLDRSFIQRIFVDGQVLSGKAAEDNFLHLGRCWQHSQNCIDCHARSKLYWITIDARADTRESYRNRACRTSHLKGASVAGGQEIRLPIAAAAPDRTNRVNDVVRPKPVAPSEFGIASLAATKQAAFVYQVGSRSAMNRAINSTAAKQR